MLSLLRPPTVFATAAVLLLAGNLSSQDAAPAQPAAAPVLAINVIHIVMETSQGNIELELYPARAPQTGAKPAPAGKEARPRKAADQPKTATSAAVARCGATGAKPWR